MVTENIIKIDKITYLIHRRNGTLAVYREKLILDEIRKKYPFVEREIAILRQKDEKPEEYVDWYNYNENCKARVDTALKEAEVLYANNITA